MNPKISFLPYLTLASDLQPTSLASFQISLCELHLEISGLGTKNCQPVYPTPPEAVLRSPIYLYSYY
ncbi:hypothetical protein NPIL_264831 [Nephila pilipes]|uniref:Uncharacterized protein n=1 Tax=Nephila pilipes TaxID=299642 RepID=A0A8X6NXT3_NEPPI|nr:hypothetical protein NPIL_264831 [Nephila pilipes]